MVAPTGYGSVSGRLSLRTPATVQTPQLSEQVAMPIPTRASARPGSLQTVWSGGQVIAGACASTTVTVNEQLVVLPAASVAVQVTVVAPTGKVEPEGGLHCKVRPGQLSVAVEV